TTGKGTGFIRSKIYPLLECELISFYMDKTKKVYFCTPAGALCIDITRTLLLALELPPEFVKDEVQPRILDVNSYILRTLNKELFDREAAKGLDMSKPVVERLRAMILTIHPQKQFTREELWHEYRTVFPHEKLEISLISTYLSRYRDEKNRHYIQNLLYKGKGVYVLE
ncbi:MAG: hypothetical protein PHW58_07505, partial [Candidatus Methanofastidiosa archaeon]|nr:hypothetical protein [Candidatus Methanofastidiosa archaeon]